MFVNEIKVETLNKKMVIGDKINKKLLLNIAKLIFDEKHKSLTRQFDVNGKILLYGKPGVGKTSLAYFLGSHCIKEYGINVYKLNIDEIIESELGKTNSNIVKAFEEVKNKAKKYGGILLIDEIDRLCVDRVNNNEISELKRMMISLMDFLDEITYEDKLIVIGITNIEDNIDKALLRRFDIKVEIKNTTEQLKEYLKNYLEKIEFDLNVNNFSDIFFKNNDTCNKINIFFKEKFIHQLTLEELETLKILKENIKRELIEGGYYGI